MTRKEKEILQCSVNDSEKWFWIWSDLECKERQESSWRAWTGGLIEGKKEKLEKPGSTI